MPLDTYRSRLAEREQTTAQLAELHGRIAHARLAAFFFGVALLWPIFSTIGWPWWLLAFPLIGFIALAVWHERIGQRLRRMREAVRFYSQGLARLEDRWAGTGNPGTRYQPAEHLYAADLDILGSGSLFELLCTARTQLGEQTLAEWLLAPATSDVIRARQEAVAELRDELDFRETLALVGSELSATVDSQGLIAWGTAPARLRFGWPRLLLDVAVLATVGAGVLWSMEWMPLGFVFLAIFGQIIYVAWQARGVQKVLNSVESKAAELALLTGLLVELEKRTWKCSRLQELRANLDQGANSATRAIGQLSELLDRLAWRHNAMFLPIAGLFLWGTRYAYHLESWQAVHGPKLRGWLTAVGEFESLAALANYSFEHAEEPFPTIAEGGVLFDGVNLKHPLMPRRQCVANSVRLDDSQPLLIVSGSNMSGKSTLLRIVGIHSVMALAGAPTPCEKLTLSVLNVGATLRIQDSLQEGRSRFYAEILRLKQIVQLANTHEERGTGNVERGSKDRHSLVPHSPFLVPHSSLHSAPLLFLLDEILHGTNSHDRQLGAAGVIQGLLERGAIGLVTTHDLALAALADELKGRAVNVHFADRFDAGTLDFDYQMRPGVVKESNALALMRAVGLEV